jgi:hypothetical protein
MRVFFTVLLSLLFGLGFATFVVVHAVLGYLTDPDAFLETAREADLRRSVVEAIEADSLESLTEDPRLDPVERAGLHAFIDQAIEARWFEESLVTTHGVFVAALDESSKTAVVDLATTKKALQDALRELEANTEARCAELFGAAACADPDRAKVMIAAFRANLSEAIDEIPATLDLLEVVTGEGEAPPEVKKHMDEVRNSVDLARTARWIGLGLLGLCLLLIAAVNATSLARASAAVGSALLVGAVLFAILAGVYSNIASSQLDEACERGRQQSDDQIDLIAAEASCRFGTLAVSKSAHRAAWPVAGIGTMGSGLVAFGVITTRRRRG